MTGSGCKAWTVGRLVVAVALGSGLLLAQAPAAAGLAADSGTAAAGAGFRFTNPFDAYAAAAQGAATGGFSASAMQGSLLGTPGLWSTQFAETLAPGQVSSGAYIQRYSRAPGGLVFTDVDTGWTVGITSRLELSYVTTPYRRVRLTHPEELTFGPDGTFGAFNSTAPFARNPLLVGPVDWSLGATLNLLSQARGDKFGLAIQFMEHFPYTADYGLGVSNYGVGTTEPEFQENVLIDKWLGEGGEMAFNVGYQHNGTADAGGRVNIPLRDQFNYGFGEIFPLHARLQGIVELNGSTEFGAGASGDPYEGVHPMDLTGGVRINPLSWMGINAGYRFAADSPRTNPSGFVFGLSFGPPPFVAAPPPPPPPPTLACSVDQSVVAPGATVAISSTVSPQGTYTYAWTTTGGQLTPSDSTAALNTTGLVPGMYTVSGRATNATGATADCQTQVEVRQPPQHPPTASCAVDPSSVLPGATLTFSATASSPDQRPLTYSWQVSPASAGHLDTDSQASVHLDTTGGAPGAVTGTLKVTDDRGLSASCSADATIQAPAPPPEASLATTLQFKPNSSRVDNAAKAALDDVALRLQQDATAHAVIIGYATSTERTRPLSAAATLRLAEERAVNAKAYLVQEKGIASDRIEVRHGDAPQKAEVWIVPQGATYAGPGETFDENAVHAPAHRAVRRTPHR
ncbi:MAG: OmpA family protein [Terriglobales bacterium]